MDKSLIKRVIKDIRDNPSRLDQYLTLLAKKGYLKDVKTLKLKKASSELLKSLETQKTTIILKG